MTVPDLCCLTDNVAVCRFYRMALKSKAIEYDDRSPEFAELLREASKEAGRLADESAEVALFVWANRGAVEP